MYLRTFTSFKNALKSLCLIVSASIFLVSCLDEDFGYNDDYFRKQAYDKKFEKFFGEVDPDHDWSMAQNVNVHINVPNSNGYRVRILTEIPTNRESILLYQGEMVGDALDANVDVVRGTKYVYVELSCDLGVYLVDGYYKIEENGNVMVNKSETRALSTPPNVVAYQQTLQRWSRIWNDSKAVSNPYQWDWGFGQNVTHLISGDVNKIPTGWKVTYDGSDRSSTDTYDGGPRIFSINEESTAFGSKVTKSLFIRKTGTVVQYGGFNNKYIYLSSGPTIVHLAFSKRKGRQDGLTVEMVGVNNQGNVMETKSQEFGYFPSNDPGDGSAKIEFDDKSFSFNAKGGRYYLRITVSNGDDSEGTSFAGFRIEAKDANSTLDDKMGFHIYNEDIDRYISYRDVRGGAVNKYGTLQLRNEATYRNNGGNTHFQYRTYNVEMMKDSHGNSDPSEGSIGPFYMITGGDGEAIRDGFENIKYRDIFPLYGMYKSTQTNGWKGAPFREGVNHIDPFFTDAGFHNATDLEMSPEAQLVTMGSIHTEKVDYNGHVRVKLVGKGTDHGNDVGYFYYPKSEESKVMDIVNGKPSLNFNKLPKIIIRKRMESALEGQQVSNLTSSDNIGGENRLWSFQFNRYVDGCSALYLPGYERDVLKNSELFKKRYDEDYCGVRTFITGLEANPTRISAAADATFKAPIYELPYYGWNYETSSFDPSTSSAATFEWPKDMVIGFFGIRTDSDFAAELSRIYTSSASAQLNYFNDLPRGSAFSYKGKNYIGLEDEWDYDNNDFLFEVQGVHSVDPDITPEDDPETVKTTQDWIVACEDLGGDYDYDFNDLVWAISKEVNVTKQGDVIKEAKTDFYFTPLAAGGTLEAIVEYNTSIALDDSDPAWDENKWEPLGEIHALVSKNPNADYTHQLNVWYESSPTVTKNMIGDRIHLGSTIPIADASMNINSVLKHFRVRVKKSGEEDIVVTAFTGRKMAYDREKGNKTPQIILLPQGWDWPGESVCIKDVYNIENWAQNQEETGWWNYWQTNRSSTYNYMINPLK